MASKGVTSIALLVLFNLLFFTMVSSTHVPCPPPPKSSGSGGGGGGHKGGSPAKAKCPKDTLKLGVCANLLNDLVHLIVGPHPKQRAARSSVAWLIWTPPFAFARPLKPMYSGFGDPSPRLLVSLAHPSQGIRNVKYYRKGSS
ncbi:hypothetical protein DH2020_027596 [Rehmannia glutinosa]|uniref:Uncharacterized protein n=1 Tax=Rehmannia glutinosa TaxID=99300 RepID=A0ABR0VXL0_REHGL